MELFKSAEVYLTNHIQTQGNHDTNSMDSWERESDISATQNNLN